ncbi:MAG: NADH-quinone oxidoreductase subunit G [Rhodospirillales bacterium]|jgi:NADH-quinone oxidoreductase subunit G|nr:NADH-quinone oxidoreductase subunit G [Rhodospirillales bacterium]
MPKLTIDGTEVEVEAGLTVLQACRQIGIEIPHFCYHERLPVSGNCRMCLVEMERAPKPVASCSMPIADGMVIRTDTEKVRQMRRSVMEFLLINHPLDCPICDQGGECDLQDQAIGYGAERSRYREKKRAVEEKDLGPLVRTVMTRCIHCTRCIRFITNIAGVPEMGATARGEHMEVGTYVEKALSSELSGNIIDLCPVGALTSAPYAFTARPWELAHTESVDVHDALGSNIRIDTRGSEVMRVLPRVHEDVNEEWISDKSRFANDGLKRARLDQPWVRRDGKLQPASWVEAFSVIAERLKDVKGAKIAALAGDLADCESMVALKDLMTALGSTHLDCRQDGAKLDASVRSAYLFNSTVAGIEQADACLLIGTDPRKEAPVLNARLRKQFVGRASSVGVVGPNVDLTYDFDHLGEAAYILKSIASGKHEFAKILQNAERPMLIVGQGALTREDGAEILAVARQIAEKTGMIDVAAGWNGFNVLHTAAARVGGLDLGFVPGKKGRDTAAIVEGAKSGDIEVLYLLGADEIDTDGLGDAFVIYQGHHGDAGAARADVIMPGAAYTEKNATYVNTEGRVQLARLATYPPGDAREDWKILRALSDALGKTLKFNTLSDVRDRLVEVNPVFAKVDTIEPGPWGEFGHSGKVEAIPFTLPVANFHMTDPICRASSTMSACSGVFNGDEIVRTGTDA